MVTGTSGSEAAQYYVAAECAIITESISLRDATIDLISSYYVFDVEYPKVFMPLYIFFQHFVFGLKDGQKVPPSALKLASNIGKM